MKKERKKKVVYIMTTLSLMVVGGVIAYKKIPGVKNFVKGIFSTPPSPTTTKEIKTKPFRKYETYHKK